MTNAIKSKQAKQHQHGRQREKARAYERAWRATPKGQYIQQRSNAAKRGIPFTLTFDQWLTIWGDKLRRRGRCASCLVMARSGDSGPYAIGNVKILEGQQNTAEAESLLPRGQNHHQATVTEAKVRKIKAALLSGDRMADIARELRVSYRVVEHIKSEHSWRHVK